MREHGPPPDTAGGREDRIELRLALPPDRLTRICDPAGFSFETTAEVAPLEDAIGQPRALRAIEFGLGVEMRGYNVFAAGPVGTGKRSTIARYLRDYAARQATPGDWVYLFNFKDDERPLAVRLAPGRGSQLASDMSDLVSEARRRIPRAFESDDYRERRRELAEEVEQKREEGLSRLREKGGELSVGVNVTPMGVATFPLIEGRQPTPEEFAALPPDLQETLRKHGEEIGKHVEAFVREVLAAERAAAARIRALDHEVAGFAIGHLIDDLERRYADARDVKAWLSDVREDIVENLDQFRTAEAPPDMPPPLAEAIGHSRGNYFIRYFVNALVSNDPDAGAPVVFEPNPTYHRLFGRIDYQPVFGAVTTDHSHIRAGATHRANGGYLVLQATDVLTSPFVWKKLKEVLRSGLLPLENIGTELTMFPTATLTPSPIDLQVKVILIGPAGLFELLHALDEDFRKLFKVKADFDVEIPWEEDEPNHYARFISRQVSDDGLMHFDRSGVARVVEHGARTAGDQHKLSTRFMDVADLVVEASHWAAEAGSDVVRAEHVQKALDEREFRSNLTETKVRDAASEETLLIDVTGEVVGQVNGLAVVELGGYAFGRPVRITATTAAGEGDVIDIDRETELSGPLHDKGFLILSGYVQSRFGHDRALALKASIVFEQSYAEVEGDSASSAELYALLSSLAGVPVRQSIAVTGSVNQQGQIQAIGGVNEKIEGFFRTCKAKGLTGDQGVLIPASNTRHLMVEREVRDAVAAGRFRIWAASTIEEGIELLSGIPAGERRADGSYPRNTVNGMIEQRFAALSEAIRVQHGDGRTIVASTSQGHGQRP
ncbi:MAG TPA: ATP-binding protein [Methylomirabilota bacterium]